jgi:hypothetical protein
MALWNRAPVRPVSESGRLRRGDGNQERNGAGARGVAGALVAHCLHPVRR